VLTLDASNMDDMEDDTRDCIRKSYEFLDEIGTKQMLTTKITKGTQRKPKPPQRSLRHAEEGTHDDAGFSKQMSGLMLIRSNNFSQLMHISCNLWSLAPRGGLESRPPIDNR
jgi:hypothetical protein